MRRLPANHALRTTDATPATVNVRANLRAVLGLLLRGDIWRWLLLLQFSDLMLDVLFALLALYMVDVVDVSPAQASIAIVVWTGVGLIGDLLLIPLLERVRGLTYLRLSAGIELVLFPLFLLVEPFTAKLVLLGIIGLFNAGWYAILQGQLYDALDEQSGTVLVIGNAAGIFGAALPVLLGVVAESFGLEVAMWLLIAGPIVLIVALPRTG